MRMEKFIPNLLAPTYLYFLSLLRIFFSICKGSNSDNRRQRRNGYQDPRAHQSISVTVCQSTNPSAKAGYGENTTRRGLSSRQGSLRVSEDRRVQQPQSCPCSMWARVEVSTPPRECWGARDSRALRSPAESLHTWIFTNLYISCDYSAVIKPLRMAMAIRESQGLMPALAQPRCWAEPRTSLAPALGGRGRFWGVRAGSPHFLISFSPAVAHTHCGEWPGSRGYPRAPALTLMH